MSSKARNFPAAALARGLGLATLAGAFWAASPATAGTVAYYNFEGAAGSAVSQIMDDGPDGLNGTVTGSMRYSADVAGYDVAGSTSLDATADFDFGKVLDSPAMHTPEFTVEVFVRARYDAFTGGGEAPHTILAKLNSTGNGYNLSAYSLGYDPATGRFSAQVGFGGTSPADGLTAQSGLHKDNQWHHLALTYRQAGGLGVLDLYVDGQLEQSLSSAYRAIAFGSQPLYIGAGNWGLGSFGENGTFRRNFLGNIDAIRISDTALDPSRFLNAAAAVPEPASMAMAGLGLALAGALALRGRRRAG